MAKPEFPLEIVLQQRQRREEERQLELAARQQQLDAERMALDSFQTAKGQALVLLGREQGTPSLDLAAIEYFLVHIDALGEAIAEQARVVRDLGRRCDEAREHLLQASREVKVVDKLKDNWLAEQQREWLRREEKATAEAAIGQHNRRVGASASTERR